MKKILLISTILFLTACSKNSGEVENKVEEFTAFNPIDCRTFEKEDDVKIKKSNVVSEVESFGLCPQWFFWLKWLNRLTTYNEDSLESAYKESLFIDMRVL